MFMQFIGMYCEAVRFYGCDQFRERVVFRLSLISQWSLWSAPTIYGLAGTLYDVIRFTPWSRDKTLRPKSLQLTGYTP